MNINFIEFQTDSFETFDIMLASDLCIVQQDCLLYVYGGSKSCIVR